MEGRDGKMKTLKQVIEPDGRFGYKGDATALYRIGYPSSAQTNVYFFPAKVWLCLTDKAMHETNICRG